MNCTQHYSYSKDSLIVIHLVQPNAVAIVSSILKPLNILGFMLEALSFCRGRHWNVRHLKQRKQKFGHSNCCTPALFSSDHARRCSWNFMLISILILKMTWNQEAAHEYKFHDTRFRQDCHDLWDHTWASSSTVTTIVTWTRRCTLRCQVWIFFMTEV